MKFNIGYRTIIRCSLVLLTLFTLSPKVYSGPFGNYGAAVIDSSGGYCCMYHFFRNDCTMGVKDCKDSEITN